MNALATQKRGAASCGRAGVGCRRRVCALRFWNPRKGETESESNGRMNRD